MLAGLDHVAITIPATGEPIADAFYQGILGMARATKPSELAKAGGLWYELPDGRQLHLQAVSGDFEPLARAHPGFRCPKLEELAARLSKDGFLVEWDTRYEGVRRFYTLDPFGNRLEFLNR